MRIVGRVTSDVSQDQETGRYRIRVDGKEYQIVSCGRQAIKDYLFVRKGQKMELEGEAEGMVFRPVRCRIKLELPKQEGEGE